MSDAPKPPPFTPRTHREAITRETDPGGKWTTAFPEMNGYKSQGGGKVPADLFWDTNPKQSQEELTEQELRHALEHPAPKLPSGNPPPGTP